MERVHSLIFGVLAFIVVLSVVLNVHDGGVSGFAIKTLHKPELKASLFWVERRYVCDLPNRDDCIHCCDVVKRFVRGPAALIDFESCVVKMPKDKIEGAAHAWEDCIRVVSGLKPKWQVQAVEEVPQRVSLLAPHQICSLLTKKPERPLIFMPYHPMMLASLVC